MYIVQYPPPIVLKLLDKANIANIMAAVGIIAGIVSVFLGIESNEMLVLITGAGIGYLFKNGVTARSSAAPVEGQRF